MVDGIVACRTPTPPSPLHLPSLTIIQQVCSRIPQQKHRLGVLK
ncbi:hypothetical protein PHET_01572 [Paragonimus heterotremus]|uniref:Uncharacterized protein n=1 Tax=Paragonimus heterotremus TaxID=100268 RepID=A0A8J4T5A0_9TREM|nr:hypothetical protein PHET_01572 [Paragonimus heterotremus]